MKNPKIWCSLSNSVANSRSCALLCASAKRLPKAMNNTAALVQARLVGGCGKEVYPKSVAKCNTLPGAQCTPARPCSVQASRAAVLAHWHCSCSVGIVLHLHISYKRSFHEKNGACTDHRRFCAVRGRMLGRFQACGPGNPGGFGSFSQCHCPCQQFHCSGQQHYRSGSQVTPPYPGAVPARGPGPCRT